MQPVKSSGTGTPNCSRRAITKIDRVRQSLLELLPSQEDADLIAEYGNCWMLVQSMSTHAASIFDREKASPFNMEEVSKKHPTLIAQTLMFLAICLQQLDPDFDTNRLHLYPTINARIERYLTTVHAQIIADDEIVSRMEGLVCVFL
jgi:hypothetical protein